MGKHLLLIFLLLIFACSDKKEAIVNANPRPNVIIVFTDDQGYADVGAFGAEGFKTPNLDQLGEEGVRLTSYYAAQAVCSASRAGLLTGCYPNRIGIHNAFMPNSTIGLNPEETTLAELLKDNGYKTAIYGKWHLGDHPDFLPTKHGFDEFFGIPYSNDMWPLHPQQGSVFNFGPLPLYEQEAVVDTLTDQSNLTRQLTERSVDFINRNKENPFFLYVPHPQPHVPLYVSDQFKGKSEKGLYGDVIMELDWSVGEIMKSLKENGLDENTIVIFTSDNGPWLAYGNHAGSAHPFREGKGTAWEGGHREPFFIRYPKMFPAGKVVHEPVMAIDLLPTIAELTNSKLPVIPIDGKSAVSVLKGEKRQDPATYFFYYKTNELHAVRQGKWKMYFPHNYRTMEGQVPGKDGFPGNYSYIDLPGIELYNLETDREEKQDVANQYPEIVEQMNILADSIRGKLGDALLGIEGKETRPPGIIQTD